MQRGILLLTKEEVADIIQKLPMEKYADSPLSNKLISAVNYDVPPQQEIDIELSEEELEIIMDEMGVPNSEIDTEFTRSAMKKIHSLLMKFRETQF